MAIKFTTRDPAEGALIKSGKKAQAADTGKAAAAPKTAGETSTQSAWETDLFPSNTRTPARRRKSK